MKHAELVKSILNSPEALADWTKANLLIDKFAIFDVTSWVSSKEQFRQLCLDYGQLLGDLVVQNADGAKIVEVYDRNVGTISSGARYHQTREGGDIHVDSVNSITPFSYLILGCVAPAAVGGESILVRADQVYTELLNFPDVVEALQEEFWFEERGMHKDEEPRLFTMPILSINENVPKFRYLRSYIESAHKKAGVEIGARERFAFDTLDSVLGREDLQFRRTLQSGEVLVTIDTEVFHGRTGFSDEERDTGWSPQRRMLRLWIS